MLKISESWHTPVWLAFIIVAVIAAGGSFPQGPAPIDLPQDAIMESDDALTRPLSPLEEALLHPSRMIPLPPDQIDSETLWLARAIFSETKRPEEQVLVGWVIRNRVETGFRGKRTYESVVLDPYQFSAFLKSNEKRNFYTSLTPQSRVVGWKQTLRIAYDIRNLDADYRPFPPSTRHFYSERSMTSGAYPTWAHGRNPVQIDSPFPIDQNRFRFFEGIS